MYARACFFRPPMKWYASSERPSPRGSPEGVARLLECVERIRHLQRAVRGLADEEVFELEPDLEVEPGFARARELAAQNSAGVVRPLLPLDVDVAGEAREIRLPRH